MSSLPGTSRPMILICCLVIPSATKTKGLPWQDDQRALHAGHVLGADYGVYTRLAGCEGDPGDFPALYRKRIHNARDRGRVRVAVDTHDFQRHGFSLLHYDRPGGPLVGRDLPPPGSVRGGLDVPRP